VEQNAANHGENHMAAVELFDLDDRIVCVRLNRPDRLNAIDGSIIAGMDTALDRLSSGAGVTQVGGNRPPQVRPLYAPSARSTTLCNGAGRCRPDRRPGLPQPKRSTIDPPVPAASTSAASLRYRCQTSSAASPSPAAIRSMSRCLARVARLASRSDVCGSLE